MKKCFWGLLAVMVFSCDQNNDTIKVKGSDTEVNLAVQLAETFQEVTPDVFVSISGGGSGLGIASLLNGTTDIANSSRPINGEEMKLFREEGIAIDSFIFAQDAVAIVVAKSLPLDSISTKQLAGILSGKYKNWSAVSTKNQPINIYGRQSNSGTHDYVKHQLDIQFSPRAKEMNGNAQILEAIKSDDSGVGYVGAGYVIHGGSKGIKTLPVYIQSGAAAVSPLDGRMIAAGKYFFQRPLYQYFKADSYQKLKPFLDFEKSAQGQRLIESAGYYPVNK